MNPTRAWVWGAETPIRTETRPSVPSADAHPAEKARGVPFPAPLSPNPSRAERPPPEAGWSASSRSASSRNITIPGRVVTPCPSRGEPPSPIHRTLDVPKVPKVPSEPLRMAGPALCVGELSGPSANPPLRDLRGSDWSERFRHESGDPRRNPYVRWGALDPERSRSPRCNGHRP